MIKWNEEYEVYVSDDGHVYNKDMKEYNFILDECGYFKLRTHRGGQILSKFVHILVYETFIGKKQHKLVIDHINRDRTDNRLSNLRCVESYVNNLNRSDTTEFGIKFREHYGFGYEGHRSLHSKEYQYWKKYGKCRWEDNTFRIGYTFRDKYKAHFGYNCSKDRNQYSREYRYFKQHGKCSWE